MFAGLRNYIDGLQYSERFENNNFAYYNDYEVRQEYEGDLTKMFYNCLRKVTPLFVLFRDTYNRSQRAIDVDSLPQFKTMDELTTQFYQIFNQSNFQDTKEDLEEFKYRNTVKLYPDEFEFVKKTQGHSLTNLCELSINSIRDFWNFMHDEGVKLCEILQNLQEEYSPQQIDFYTTWLNLEQLMLKRLDEFQEALDVSKSKGVEQPLHQMPFMAFKYIVEDLVGQITSAQLWSTIVLTIPNNQWFKNLVHPMTIALQGFMSKEISVTRSASEQGIQNPKILFINLDGKQSPMNIRAIRSIKQSLFYITLFKQPQISEQLSEQFQTTNLSYSKLIMSELSFPLKERLLREKQEGVRPDNSDRNFKILGFPLQSQYLRQEYRRRNNRKDDFKPFCESEEILFIFEHAIYNQIRDYVPNAIVVSYNGRLNIRPEHWNEIIRNLTIIGDHRVLLFPNLSECFTDPQATMDVDITPEEKFLSEYMPYNFDEINQERFFANIAMFTKITSGAYSLEDRQVLPDSAKYQIGVRHEYFEKLANLPDCESYEKYVAKFWKASELKSLMQQQTGVLLKMNATENQDYGTLIDKAVQKINEFDIDDDKIKVELQRLYFQHQDNMGLELQSRKQELMLQNIFQTKITKVYHEMSLNTEKLAQKIKVCRFKLANSDNYELRFQHITQFLFNEREAFVIVLNHRMQDGTYVHLSGSLHYLSERGEVMLTPIPDTQTPPDQPLYLAYAHCFSQNVVYLIWPQEFKPIDAIIAKLVGFDYQPNLVNRVCKITVDPETFNAKYEVMKPAESKMDIQGAVVPRYGVSCWCADVNKIIYLFGGIYSNREDFLELPSTITRLHLNKDGYYFKKLEKSLQRDRLRPKMGYVVQPKKDNDREVIIWGGYGRNFTNTYNIFSCISYEFNADTKTLTKFKHPMRTIKLERPIATNKAGKFNMIVDDKGGLKFEQRFSAGPKDKFIFQSRPRDHRSSQLGQIVAFMDQNFKISEFKTEHRKMYLFGFSKKLKENIYTSYWSPELYVHDGTKSHRIEILLQTLRNRNDIRLAKHIFPSEDSIISTGLYDNKIYLLALSHIYTNSQPTLYQASIVNLNDILEKRKLMVDIKFVFNLDSAFLEEKSMFFEDDTIFIVGGRTSPEGIREDLILQRERQNFKLRKRQLVYTKQPGAMYMPNPHVLKVDVNTFSYSAHLDPLTKKWLLRIQVISINFQKSDFFQGPLRVFAIDYEKCERRRIRPSLLQPRFIKIMKYDGFSIQFLSTCLERLQLAISAKVKDIEQMPSEESDFSEQELQEIVNTLRKALAQVKQVFSKKQYSFKKLQALGVVLKELYRKHKGGSSSDYQEEANQELLKQISNVITLIHRKEIEDSCLGLSSEEGSAGAGSSMDDQDLYRFIMEDLKDNKLVKFFAIGKLGSTQLEFVHVRFKKEMIVCSNHKNEETMFFNLFEGIYNQFQISKSKNHVFEEAIDESPTQSFSVEAKINGVSTG